MIERVKKIIELKSKSIREFALLIGVKHVTLNQQISGTRSLSLDIITAILNSFEDISAEWLLRGDGEMLKGVTAMPKSFDAKIEIDNEGCLKIKIKE